ncbi:PEP-CTERM motif protein [Symmachiella macrocystis]|uniref:PEP-CTERM motif protein n=1 Tax=Symmachiella macrocystis TaxID=2527985 RepID=A0A5C6B4X5_9PLAN|nr:PEP-CTERM sorting domain-containing protein [Symmachiella macrocystis]TWU06978.1 PEP-CTERM motif protein [Symmachiella macrocystis]
MRRFSIRILLATLVSVFVFGTASAEEIKITTIESYPPSGDQVWFYSDMRGNGTASTVDLSGEGGNLEGAAPLPIGAALLTTGASNGDKAEIAVTDSWGTAGSLIGDVNFSTGYSYYKDSSGDLLNATAAPSIKLSFYNAAYDDVSGQDGFVTLVYEPYWNQVSNPGASVAPPTDTWTTVSIDANSGLFWNTGGFGQTSSAGGPPLLTLADWLTTFDSAFASAELSAVSMGIGTYNQGQTGYFDNVSITSSLASTTYNFEPVPEPSSIAMLLGLGTFGLVGYRWRRKQQQAV